MLKCRLVQEEGGGGVSEGAGERSLERERDYQRHFVFKVMPEYSADFSGLGNKSPSARIRCGTSPQAMLAVKQRGLHSNGDDCFTISN